mmetsp:Transcript_19777/g.40847  ORF Transcript_19777/g.40847 Transcript_19777/m.40847 type:complete len:602 (-) Transcript_19777:732-2537(-)|eukprot:CAMPEP_0201131010 /NCGR_PEP_ID=MMETSP0850-20130426/41551_1 /ASSEMBLY_ACC=CAM_ASM_000622 /TAXON_ID=183588 /ORGANISM="Pseudo-nitzschia fraudulenta, Strain WWA7" /LENGTH=601 /DNA_ID=CAMNT_0047400933 /DNA_START=253 /DNA_END=2058 /DNA_ORIENTATION=+
MATSNQPYVPQFGVCLGGVLDDDAKANAIDHRCVLSEASCGTNEVYRAPFESNIMCYDPFSVKVGRCTSSLDDERCGPSEASCSTKGPFYEPIDLSCSLVSDTSLVATVSGSKVKDERTSFPACRDPTNDTWQCALDGDYCRVGETLSYSKWASEWGPDPCYCEDVPTGVCYETRSASASNSDTLGPENAFCAVGPADCPTTHGWMSARAFLESDKATFRCTLCEDASSGDETKTSDNNDGTSGGGSSPVGACLSNTDIVSCALESTDCPSATTTFASSEILRQKSLSCSIDDTKNWGECKSSGDAIECTNKADSCLFDFRFESVGSACGIHENFETGFPTFFSYCAPRTDNDDKDWRDIRCVWDDTECDMNTERWEEARLPNDAWFDGCLCEDVLLGACKEPSTGIYHCAVSAKGCDDPASYVPQHSLKARGIDLECPLCPPRPPTDAPEAAPAAVPTLSPVVANRPTIPLVSYISSPPTSKPTFWPTDPPYYATSGSSSSGSAYNKNGGRPRNSLSQGAIAGIIVGSMVVCFLLVLVIAKITGNGSRSQKAAAKRGATMTDANNDELEQLEPDVEIESGESQPTPDHEEDLVPASAELT